MQSTITIDFDRGGTLACLDHIHTGGNSVLIHAIAAKKGGSMLVINGSAGTMQVPVPAGETELTVEVPTAYYTEGNKYFTVSLDDASATFESTAVSLDGNVWVRQVGEHSYQIIEKRAETGVTYPLPAEKGGTGVTSIAELQNLLGISYPLPANKGGTGTTSIAKLKELLGIADSGWKALSLADGVTPGSYGGRATPSYRKIGNHVFIEGCVTVTPGTSAVQIATLPAGYRPSRTLHGFAECSGRRVGRINLGAGGSVNVEWVVNINDGSYCTTEIWCNVRIDFFVD